MYRQDLFTALKITAVFCAYLVMSLPVISAVQIRAYIPGSDTPTEFSFDPSEKIERVFSVLPIKERDSEIWVNVSVVGRDPQYILKKIYLFRCKGSDPASCSDDTPIEAVNYLSGRRKTFKWTGDLAVGKVANFMTIVQLEYKGKGIWLGFWDQLERLDVNRFSYNSYDFDAVDIYVNDGINVEWVRYFMENYFMIPADWMEYAMLGSVNGQDIEKVSKLEADRSDMIIHEFRTSAGQERVVPGDYTYTFLFGRDPLCSALTFFSEPATSCDGFECEAGLGETPENCCIDCRCRQENQECDTSTEYPGGLCHVCGDGVPSPVENYNNCCADAGCPEGQSCDTDRNKPYGTCLNPECANNRCDTPEEDVTDCCIDCGGTDACKAAMGDNFYCNPQLVRCVEPVCGERGCEPGEDYSNCCLDCGGCPSGKYCNLTLSQNGVCVKPGCGTNGCEPGEDESNCCLDCGCLLDMVTGEEQTCTLNVCHLCGNGVVEDVENRETCCIDTGCNETYCSADYSCREHDEIGLNVMVRPEDGIDCRQAGNVILPMKVVMSLENKPEYFSHFHDAEYNVAGKKKTMRNCIYTGEAFECDIPLSGSGIFEGCFEGEKTHDVGFSVMISYYNDTKAYSSNDATEQTLRKVANVTVVKSKERICDKKDTCDTAIGEDSNSCCNDCGCPPGLFCLENSCLGEDVISLEVDGTSFPPENELVCNREHAVREKVTFIADVGNFPNTLTEPFGVSGYELFYIDKGKSYTANNLTGFECLPETTTEGQLTGKIFCEIPMALFPPCPYESPASMKLRVWITGGGLSILYDSITGKMIEDEFEVNFQEGLPKCNDGYGTCDDGENQDNCCVDCGCTEGDFCSVYGGCRTEDEMTLDVWVEPDELDCSESLGRKVRIFAEVSPKPVGLVFFDYTSMDNNYIQFMCLSGQGTKYGSEHTLECSMPYDNFGYCWGVYGQNAPFDFSLPFETEFSYYNGTEYRSIDLEETAIFKVTTPRERGCNDDSVCDIPDGEIIDQCCLGCGCTGGKLCNFEGNCIGSDPALVITSFPDEVDCSEYSEIELKVRIDDQPAWSTFNRWKWNASVSGVGEVAITPDCRPDEVEENVYICELSPRLLPICKIKNENDECTENDDETYDCDRKMEVSLNLSYIEAGTFDRKYFEKTANKQVSAKNILASCGTDNTCSPELNEDYLNCCEDCPCQQGDVCTSSGCYPKESIVMTFTPIDSEKICNIRISSSYDFENGWPPHQDDLDEAGYECVFKDSFKVSLTVDPMPYGIDDGFGTFRLPEYGYASAIEDFDSDGMEISMIVRGFGAESTESFPSELDLEVSMDIDINLPGGSYTSIFREDNVTFDIETKNTEKLNSLEDIVRKFKRRLWWIKGLLAAAGILAGICITCPGNLAEDPVGLGKKIDQIKGLIGGIKYSLSALWRIVSLGGGFAAILGTIGVTSGDVYAVIGFFAGGLAVGAIIGGFMAASSGLYCIGKPQGEVCTVLLIVAGALAAAAGVIALTFSKLKGQYEDAEKTADANVGDSMDSWILIPL